MKESKNESTFLIKITWRVVWKVVSQTLSSLFVRCFSDIYVPDIENSDEPPFELFHSTSCSRGDYAGLGGEVVDVVVQSSPDSASNLIAEFFISVMMFRASVSAK